MVTCWGYTWLDGLTNNQREAKLILDHKYFSAQSQHSPGYLRLMWWAVRRWDVGGKERDLPTVITTLEGVFLIKQMCRFECQRGNRGFLCITAYQVFYDLKGSSSVETLLDSRKTQNTECKGTLWARLLVYKVWSLNTKSIYPQIVAVSAGSEWKIWCCLESSHFYTSRTVRATCQFSYVGAARTENDLIPENNVRDHTT